MDDSSGVLALLAGMAVFAAFFLVLLVFCSFCLGRLFERAGKPMWAGFVPIYNLMIWAEITGRPNWWIAMWLGAVVIMFIPYIGGFALIAMMIISSIDLAKSFGKDVTFGVLMGIFFPILIAVLAFGDNSYSGPSVTEQPSI